MYSCINKHSTLPSLKKGLSYAAVRYTIISGEFLSFNAICKSLRKTAVFPGTKFLIMHTDNHFDFDKKKKNKRRKTKNTIFLNIFNRDRKQKQFLCKGHWISSVAHTNYYYTFIQ